MSQFFYVRILPQSDRILGKKDAIASTETANGSHVGEDTRDRIHQNTMAIAVNFIATHYLDSLK